MCDKYLRARNVSLVNALSAMEVGYVAEMHLRKFGEAVRPKSLICFLVLASTLQTRGIWLGCVTCVTVFATIVLWQTNSLRGLGLHRMW